MLVTSKNFLKYLPLAAILATPAHSAPVLFQVTVTANVEQDILTLDGDPNFFDEGDPNIVGDGFEGFPFFDRHIDVLTDFGNETVPWDPSQIPTAPDQSLAGTPYNVISQGSLTGTWTFDASVLATDLTQTSINSNGEGTLLGSSNAISTFEVIALGESIGGAITTTSQVFAANNVVVGVDGEMLDLIGIQAQGGDLDGEGTEGVVLILGGADNWFETANGEIPNFENMIVTGAIEFEDIVSSNDGDQLYEERINGSLDGAAVSFASFGAADGTAEDSPLLPGGVVIEDGADAPTFTFDVSVAGAGFVFVDPEIAVGYTYELSGDGRITGIKAPSLGAVNDADGYVITLPDGQQFRLLPGEEISLQDGVVVMTQSGDTVTPGDNIRTLTLTDIATGLELDPLDNTTFVAGFLFEDTGQNSVFEQTALVIDTDDLSAVPLPASMAFLLAGLGGLGLMRRRKTVA